MKKLLKKVLSVAAATALLMTSVISATATSASGPTYDADKKYTINITASGDKDVKDYPEHLYAFQIFSGTVPDEQKNADEDGNVTNPGTLNTTLQLTDIKWGTGIKSDKDSLTALMGALSDAPAFKENSIFTGFVTGNSTSGYTLSSTYLDSENNVLADKLAVAVANVLSEKLVNNRQYMQYFTDIVGGYKSSDSTLNNFLSSTYLTAELSTDDDSPIWKFNDVSAGYYLILANDLRQVSGSPTPPEGAAFPARMLFVASNVSQQIKESVPVFDKFVVRNSTVDDKKVESNSNLKDTAVAGVGDVVEFQLRGTLPTNFEKYDVYQYIFTDTLDKGLDAVRYSDDATFDAADSSSVKVRIIGAFEKVSSASGDNIVTYTDPVTGEVSYWIWDDDIVLTLGYEGKATVNNPTPSNGYTLTYSTLTEPTASIDKRQLTITFEDLIKLRLEQDSKTYRVGFYYEGTVEGSDDYHVHNGGLDEIHSSKILVNYKAKLNKDAVVAPKNGGNLNGNLNEAYLTYSDDPSDQTKVDNTVTEDATVYTFGLTITKEDYASKLNDTVVKKLPNAEFTFLRKTGDTISPTWQIAQLTTDNTEILEWKDLTDGSNKVSADINGEELVKIVKKFVDDNDNSPTHATPVDHYYIKTADPSGVATLKGLDVDVEYTLVEIAVPTDDYAQLAPFTVTLKASESDGTYDGKLNSADGVTSRQTFDSSYPMSMEHFVQPNNTDPADVDGIGEIEVINFKYVDLPSTGGIGVYIYYIAGGIVVAAAILLFALSKKHARKSS